MWMSTGVWYFERLRPSGQSKLGQLEWKIMSEKEAVINPISLRSRHSPAPQKPSCSHPPAMWMAACRKTTLPSTWTRQLKFSSLSLSNTWRPTFYKWWAMRPPTTAVFRGQWTTIQTSATTSRMISILQWIKSSNPAMYPRDWMESTHLHLFPKYLTERGLCC